MGNLKFNTLIRLSNFHWLIAVRFHFHFPFKEISGINYRNFRGQLNNFIILLKMKRILLLNILILFVYSRAHGSHHAKETRFSKKHSAGKSHSHREDPKAEATKAADKLVAGKGEGEKKPEVEAPADPVDRFKYPVI